MEEATQDYTIIVKYYNYTNKTSTVNFGRAQHVSFFCVILHYLMMTEIIFKLRNPNDTCLSTISALISIFGNSLIRF